MFFKDKTEIVGITETRLAGNIDALHAGNRKQMFCLFDSDIGKIFNKGFPHLLGKNRTQMIGTDSNIRSGRME
jgi:hypothetical protein